VTEPHTSTPLLTDVQRRALLDLARAAVEAQVTGHTPPSVPSMTLPDATGTFVTVKTHGELRGCLGTLQVDRLARDVARCAADAASSDPRFAPVSADELEDLAIDISVLGPLEPFDPRTPEAVIVGRHGLVVEQGRHRGLLLPQVATEWGWTANQFLQQTCVKAGLPRDAWQHGARVFRFEACVFGD
jgi:AmmeMemoRadiSam system protein A